MVKSILLLFLKVLINFVSFSMQISKDEYLKTHNKAKNNNLALGIDVGLKSFLSLSNGLEIKAPKPLLSLIA